MKSVKLEELAVKPLHRLLQRQIERYLGDTLNLSRKLKDFIDAVNKAYQKLDYEYSLLERAQELNEKELERQIREKELILDSAAEGIFGIDLNGKISFINQAGAKSLGYERNRELIGKHCTIIKRISSGASVGAGDSPIMEALRAVVVHRVVDTVFLRKNGSTFPAEYTCSSVVENEKIVGAVIIFEDITDRKTAEEKLNLYARKLERSNDLKDVLIEELQELKRKLEISAKTDHLTKLFNRRGMMEVMEYEKLRFERNKRPFVFILADIDYFKTVNDTYGHDAGDFVLCQVGRYFTEVLRALDTVCRWGGEEFLVLLPETDLHGGILLAEKLRAKIEGEVFTYNRHDIRVTLSFGLCAFGESCQNIDTCLNQADKSLYTAKKEGRNRVAFHPPEQS